MEKAAWSPLVVAGLLTCVYVGTACPHVLGGDSGEFATLLATSGVAHPPGFPLYVALLRIFRFVPVASPAHAAALVTAGLGALSVLAVSFACRAWGASPGAAAIAAAAYGSSSIAWKLSTHAEAFAPAALGAALVIAASAPGRPSRGPLKTSLLGLSAGLSLCLHPTTSLIAPVGLWAVFDTVRRDSARSRCLLSGALGLTLGLTPYAYLLHVARTADPAVSWVWGAVHDARSLVSHFLRTEYGTLQLSVAERHAEPLAHVPRMLAHLTRELLGLPVVAVVAGLRFFGVRARTLATPLARRHAILALSLAFVAIGPGFAAFFNRPLTDVGPLIVERFYLLPMVPLSVLSALALDALVPRIVGSLLPLLLAPLTLATGLSLSVVAVREYSRPTLALYLQNVLGFLPEDTVVLGLGDDKFSGFLYARLAERRRPDVTYLAPAMLALPWYREREGARLGVSLASPEGLRLRVAALVRQLLSLGRPVALAGFVAEGLLRSFPTYPLGPVVMVVPRGGVPPSPDALLDMNLRVFAHFRLESPPPSSEDGWAARLQADYATPFLTLAGAFEGQGDSSQAAACRERARALSPGAPR